jgi:hypothetical protein
MAPSTTDHPRSTGGKHQFDEEEHFHIGWDWHANLWFVEPPVAYDELDVGTRYYVDRDQAFEAVDTMIREQPVQRDPITDELLREELAQIVDNADDPLPPREPVRQTAAEPVRRVSTSETNRRRYGVANPLAEQPLTSREERLSQYQWAVGL